MNDKQDKGLHAAIATICAGWWCDLNNLDLNPGAAKRAGGLDRGAIAELRRIGTVDGEHGEHVDVALAASCTHFMILHQRLRGCLLARDAGWATHFARTSDFDEAVAVVASTLARIRNDKGDFAPSNRVAVMLGREKGRDDDAKLMAEARFKRLMRTSDWPGLLDQGRRIVALIKTDVPVGDLGASLLLWNIGPRVKRDWAFAYYGATYEQDGSEGDAPTDASATSSPNI
jgi:CRISPR type I-E-associated protein CasB/Cse2